MTGRPLREVYRPAPAADERHRTAGAGRTEVPVPARRLRAEWICVPVTLVLIFGGWEWYVTAREVSPLILPPTGSIRHVDTRVPAWTTNQRRHWQSASAAKA